jgi:hypothetical protein
MASSLDLSGFFEEEVRPAPSLFSHFFVKSLILSKEGFELCY